MKISPARLTAALAALGLGVLALPAAEAASVYLTPAGQTVNELAGPVTLGLYMDFTGDPTIGGGIDLDFQGPISVGSFTPTAYFTNTADPFFTGYGTADADNDFEVHFGNFAGLSGVNKLGDLSVNLLGPGAGTIAISINSTFGAFYNIGSVQQSVTLTGAGINVVPLPAGIWLLLTGVGALAGRRVTRG
jgi:hypothetical protein